ncbi:MAG TPA: HAMP domain-containing sensor histidine kinase, partial [Acidobacteriota bacterium]|nr:HAMP domain-containing sensor histidine kinase [Acidobacteriota bacterium]
MSWALEGIAIVWFSISILRVSESFRLYLFMAAISGGLAASFVHFHIVRSGMVPVRTRIAQETGRISIEIHYPILIRLLGSFTLLIGLSLIFLTLLNHARTEDLLRQNQLPQLKVAASIPWEAGGIIVLTMLIGGFIAYFAASDISKPLNEMREATRRIADGNFDQRLNIITDDEVADLGQSINLMAAELHSKVELLQKARDMAQEKSSELEEANKELMKLDDLKSNFLANISHELKAPLVSTKGYIDFMLSGKLGSLSEKQIKGLTVSRDNLNHLSRLISSLLDFSKLTSGDLKLRADSFSLPSLMESCIETVKVEARRKEKEMQFVTEITPALPTIFGDPDRIREVLMNLLANAEKFTPAGGRIKIAVAEPAAEDDHITVSIIDNGI